MNVIDELSNSIRKFGVSRNENRFDTELNYIMDKMNNVGIFSETECIEIEWVHLKSNYSKIKYLYETINFYHIPDGGKFISSLKRFMEFIDNKTQDYLSKICWESSSEDIIEDTNRVKEYFYESLNENDPVKKLSIVVRAYQILVPIVEGFRNEKCEQPVEIDFLENFERSPKRPRLNQ